jgi:hypothetical protein
MSYNIIQPPYSLNFRSMTEEEIESYFQWFIERIPDRVAELTRAINESSGLIWIPDLTRNSLEALSTWFVDQVEVRERTPREIAEVHRKAPLADSISMELTNRTFSICVDTGMYFGESIRLRVPGSDWRLILDDKVFADYGQPVLVGRGPVPLNPVRVVMNWAYGVSQRNRGSERLTQLFDWWVERL